MHARFLLLLGAIGCAGHPPVGSSPVQAVTVEGGNCVREPASIELAVRSAQHQAAAVHVIAGEPINHEATCRQAASAYPGRRSGGGLFSVVVIPLGDRGYFVYAPADKTTAGEFVCDRATLDAQFRLIAHLCG